MKAIIQTTESQENIIQTLREAFENFQNGDLSYRINLDASGEMRTLLDEFNRMAEALEGHLYTQQNAYLAHAVHDLRSPLNAILGFAQLMLRSKALSAEDRESVSIILRSGQRLKALIDTIQDPSSVDLFRSGNLPLRSQNQDIDRSPAAATSGAVTEFDGMALGERLDEDAHTDILIVDDTPENLQLLTYLLKSRCYNVHPASNGEEALRLALKEDIDLILLDILMPDADGFEVCRWLKEHPETQDIPIIFLSALNETFDKVKAFEAGGLDYITKPFQAEEVLARVKTHLTLRSLQLELECRNKELAMLANQDGLTHIANRRYFDQRLEHEWHRLAREGGYLSLMMIDIDHFKPFNDHHGHLAGDECLKQIAHVFEQAARRASDLAARYGGEEFVLLLPNTDPKGAECLAGKIQDELARLQLPHPESRTGPFVTCSIGIACRVPDRSLTSEQFVALADDALYQAKNQGRNRYVLAT